jgi:hypothetical protein
MRPEVMSAAVRRKNFYSVPKAGRMVKLGRTLSYEAARNGAIPTQREGKFLLVPKAPWDREVKRLLGTKSRPR